MNLKVDQHSSAIALYSDAPFINMAFDPTRPYNELPLLPPLAVCETVDILKACIPAHAALAAYTQALRRSPVASDFLHSTALLDAAGALQLSGTPVSITTVLTQTDSNQAENVLRFVTVLRKACDQLETEPVGNTLALNLAESVSARHASIRRRGLNTGESVGLERVMTPPSGAERLQVFLDNWQRFVQQDAGDLEPLLLIAMAHYQYLAMRPFTFGNILSAQMINTLLLIEEDLMSAPGLPICTFFSRYAEQYWCYQHAVTAEQRWLDWLHFFIRAVTQTAQGMLEKLIALELLVDRIRPVLAGILPRQTDIEPILRVCVRPSCGIADLVSEGIARRQTAANHLRKLVDGSLLRESRSGKEKRFVNGSVIELFTDG